MVFATATRLSWGGWSEVLESVSWGRMARLLPGLNPVPPINKSPLEPRRSNLDPVVNPVAYGQTYGDVPIQPDREACVLGVNSFSQLPMRGEEFSPDVAQQMGRRWPRPKCYGAALNSGLSIGARGILERRSSVHASGRGGRQGDACVEECRVAARCVSLEVWRVFGWPGPRGQHFVGGHA